MSKAMPDHLSQTQTPNPPARLGATLAVLTVLLANIGAVSYILWAGRAGDAAVFTPESMVVTSSDTPNATPTVDNTADSGSDDEYDDEYDDWVDEPIRVINTIDLPTAEETRALFVRNCASCHGAEGRGDGPASEHLIPRPRDFVESPFRYAAEWAGEDHIIADLERTLHEGVPRSAMPAFGGVLSEEEIAGLARYVYGLRDKEQVVVPEASADVGVRPPLTVNLVKRGKELFTTLACVTCHGETGAGDGVNAKSLVDFQQKPVRPADFTSGLFKSGPRSEDLVRSILRGVPGTPMVSYEGILLVENDTEEESYNTLDAWALVAYIRTLAPATTPPGIPSGARITAGPALDKAMLTDPIHPAWLGVESKPLRVNPLQSRHEELSHVNIRAVRSDDEISICIEWEDSTLNPLNGSDDRHPDGMAVMFGLTESPSAVQVTSVETNDTEPAINEWRWGADKQYTCAGGDSSNPEIDYGVLGVLPFFVLDAEKKNATTGINSETAASTECFVVESNGMAPQPPEQQGAKASAAWIDGVWRVVITRSLKTDDTMDVQFTNERRIPISIAVWNGAEGDLLSAMTVSSWHWLELTP